MTISHRDETISQKNAEIEEKNAEIEAKNQTVSELNAVLSQKDAELAEALKALDRKRTHLKTTQNERDQAYEKVHEWERWREYNLPTVAKP